MTMKIRGIIAAILGAAVVSGVLVGGAMASPGGPTVATNTYDEQIAEANERKAEQERELEQLENDLRHMDEEIATAVRDLRELENQLPSLQEELELAEERLASAIVEQELVADKLEAAEAQDEAITAQIAADEERIEELTLVIAELARQTYRGDTSMSTLEVVLGSTTTDEFVENYSIQHSVTRAQSHALTELEDVAATNRTRGVRQEAVRDYIEELKVLADELVVETEIAREQAKEKKDAVDAKLAEVKELKDYLESKRDEALARQDELEREQEKIEEELLELIRKKFEAQNPGGNPTPIGIGHLAFPTAVPYITSHYGMRVHPVYGYSRMHAGTDFRAWCGTPIYAAAGGQVEWAQWRGGFGNHVMLDHGIVNGNALYSSYAHLTSFAVSAGQYVTQGQVIGYSGTTGTSTACHLHFEVYINGAHVNPMTLLGPIP